MELKKHKGKTFIYYFTSNQLVFSNLNVYLADMKFFLGSWHVLTCDMPYCLKHFLCVFMYLKEVFMLTKAAFSWSEMKYK